MMGKTAPADQSELGSCLRVIRETDSLTLNQLLEREGNEEASDGMHHWNEMSDDERI